MAAGFDQRRELRQRCGDLLADGLQADWGVAEAAGVALIDIQLAEPFRVIDPPWNRKKYGFDWDGQPC